jgi:hypothetical protein
VVLDVHVITRDYELRQGQVFPVSTEPLFAVDPIQGIEFERSHGGAHIQDI